MRLRIGITGGIGSGKSLVASLFALHGIPVYNADDAAKRMMESNTEIRNAVAEVFGKEILVDNKVDRKKLAAFVFDDANRLQQLNEIIHPFVLRDFERWEKDQNAPYTLREAAILFETGIWKNLDHTLLIDAPVELRVKRVMARDGRSEKEIRNIISRQWSSEEKRKLAWRVIENDEQQLVIPQVNSIHNELMYA